MRALVVSGYGVKLSVRRGVLTLRAAQGARSVPLGEVDAVVLATSGVSVTSKALRWLARAGVMLVVLDSRGMPVSVLHHPYTTRTVSTRRAQYEAVHNGRAERVVRVVATSKLGNQAGHLRRLRRSLRLAELEEAERRISEAAEEVLRLKAATLDELRSRVMNVEAAAARDYWSAIASVLPGELGFEGRDQDGCDPVNSALNYGYGVLYSAAWRSTCLHGLDPYAGFLHVDRSGKPVLTFDVVEAFRAAGVDHPLVRALRSGLRLEVRNCLLDAGSRARVLNLVIKTLGEKFSALGEVRELEGWLNAFTDSLASYLRGESELRPLVFRW